MIGMSFTRLQIWEKGRVLVQNVYALTQAFPKEEMFGLVSQMRRAAVSIPANIAEGSQRSSEKDFAHFILIAKGSLAELHTFIYLSLDLHYITKDKADVFVQAAEELDRMLRAFRLKLKT
ncbi:MAG: four helix bundle protein [Candidatus Peregrinibacteria bacterium]